MQTALFKTVGLPLWLTKYPGFVQIGVDESLRFRKWGGTHEIVDSADTITSQTQIIRHRAHTIFPAIPKYEL